MGSAEVGALREQLEKCQYLADTAPDEKETAQFREMASMLQAQLKQLLPGKTRK